MTYEERINRADYFLNQLADTLNKKGNDYASNVDAFSNFTNTATILKVQTEKVFIAEIVKKCSRIIELLDKPAANESVMDSVLDIAGYACLLDGYLYGKDGANDESRNKEAR